VPVGRLARPRVIVEPSGRRSNQIAFRVASAAAIASSSECRCLLLVAEHASIVPGHRAETPLHQLRQGRFRWRGTAPRQDRPGPAEIVRKARG